MVTVDYAFYAESYGGSLAQAAFEAALPAAERHVKWLVGGHKAGCHATAVKRAVCAAADVFAEYGEGDAGGFSIGGFKMTRNEGRGSMTGDELATNAALKELSATSLAFAGAR